jgi:hypothetical protein
MTLAAITNGDEQADFEQSRVMLNEQLNTPFERRHVGKDAEESELRLAIGLRA